MRKLTKKEILRIVKRTHQIIKEFRETGESGTCGRDKASSNEWEEEVVCWEVERRAEKSIGENV
ncbi:MAG: hypothetical protein ACXQTO_00220 [Candidatus Syntropharchaeales archaeon]